jgi:hypothetical protein
MGSKGLILDNRNSYTTPESKAFCEDKAVVLLWVPPHSSHLLQPLDVGCFGPLQQAFSKQNQNLIRNHKFHVTKQDFIAYLYTALQTTFVPANVEAGFRRYGLQPFDPEAVLLYLDPLPQTQSPLCSQESWHTRTPSNTIEVGKQATLIQKRLQRHQSSSPTPILDTLTQLSKGAEIIATSTALMQLQILALQ